MVSINRREEMNTKIYVANLPFQTTETDLRTHFAQAGDVVSVKILKDHQSGQPRGFAFVEMSTRREAQKAISMLNKRNFMEKELLVKEARVSRGFGRGRR
jgi:cold-inducible RNA-binding protein